jgi:hypothetical protein
MPKIIYILVDGNHGGKENVAPGHGTALSVIYRRAKHLGVLLLIILIQANATSNPGEAELL